jgi:hypothetical protein
MGDETLDKYRLPFFDSDKDKRDKRLTGDFFSLVDLFWNCDISGDASVVFPNCAPNSLDNEMQPPFPGKRSKSNFVGISFERP